MQNVLKSTKSTTVLGFQDKQSRIVQRQLEAGNKATSVRSLCSQYMLKYGCESWTLKNVLIKRIDAFDRWCYRRKLKISYRDRVADDKMLGGVKEQWLHFAKNIVKLKLACAGHVHNEKLWWS